MKAQMGSEIYLTATPRQLYTPAKCAVAHCTEE